jgi:hypothetical protein
MKLHVETMSGEIVLGTDCDPCDALQLFETVRAAVAQHFNRPPCSVVLTVSDRDAQTCVAGAEDLARCVASADKEGVLRIVGTCNALLFRTLEECVAHLSRLPKDARPFVDHPRYGFQGNCMFPVWVTDTDAHSIQRVGCQREFINCYSGKHRMLRILKKVVANKPFVLEVGGNRMPTAGSVKQSDGTHAVEISLPLDWIKMHQVRAVGDRCGLQNVQVHVQVSIYNGLSYSPPPFRMRLTTHGGDFYSIHSNMLGKLFAGSSSPDCPEFTPTLTKDNFRHVLRGASATLRFESAAKECLCVCYATKRSLQDLLPFQIDTATCTVRSLRQFPKTQHVVVAGEKYESSFGSHKDADGAECGSGLFFAEHSVLLTARADAPFQFCTSADEAVAAKLDPETGEHVLDGTFVLAGELAGKHACLVGGAGGGGEPLRVRVVCELYRQTHEYIAGWVNSLPSDRVFTNGRAKMGLKMLGKNAIVPAHEQSLAELMGTEIVER